MASALLILGKANNARPGFTIVELLIVIVVIAILAAITVVAFNGVQSRAVNSSAQASLNQLYKKILLAKESGEFDMKNRDQFIALTQSVSFDSLDQSKSFPIIYGRNESWEWDEDISQYKLLDTFGLTAITKTGSVYYVSEQTGGIVQSITDWQALIDSNNGSIAYYQELIDDPEYPFDKSWLPESIAQEEAARAEHQQKLNEGTTFNWIPTASEAEFCYDNGDPTRMCFSNTTIPIGAYKGDGIGGFSYEASTKTWRTIVSPPYTPGIVQEI